MGLIRSEVVYAGMRPGLVVVVNGLGHRFAGLIKGLKAVSEAKLRFEDAVDAFGQSVFVWIAVLGHGYLDVEGFEHLYIIATAISRFGTRLFSDVDL